MRLANKRFCSGCSACYAACPNHAISMEADGEGFLYPQIKTSDCVDCGICKKVCPVLHQEESRLPLSVYAARANDEGVRMKSSSGGIFSLIAQRTLSHGGAVFGAAFDENDWHVYHRCVDDEVGLCKLRGSKYAQSDIGNSFADVARELRNGREVLFSGTPCQVAGLRRYLSIVRGVPTDRLYLIDVVCHAVSSPLVWKKYMELRVASEYKGLACDLSRIVRVSFREKKYGWKKFFMTMEFANGSRYEKAFSEDLFFRGFLFELYNRPSCHNCSSRGLRSGSDMTIGDFWGVDSIIPELDEDKGVSLILVNTKKGIAVQNYLMDRCKSRKTEYSLACRGNPVIIGSKRPNFRRRKFFASMRQFGFESAVHKCLRRSVIQAIGSLFFRATRLLLEMTKRALHHAKDIKCN